MKQMKTIKQTMDEAFLKLNTKDYIKSDPIQIVHEIANMPNISIADIEICAIWTSLLALGEREQIISYAEKLMDMCNWQPADFVKTGDFYDLSDDLSIYRTIKGKQFKAINHNLRVTYNRISSVADYIVEHKQTINELIVDLAESLQPARLGSPSRNSSCKRINLLLRWMVRHDDIDLGIWKTKHIQPKDLYAIMDARVAKQASWMGFISYSQESWKAVLELTNVYRSWNKTDPLKYDFVFMTNNFR